MKRKVEFWTCDSNVDDYIGYGPVILYEALFGHVAVLTRPVLSNAGRYVQSWWDE